MLWQWWLGKTLQRHVCADWCTLEIVTKIDPNTVNCVMLGRTWWCGRRRGGNCDSRAMPGRIGGIRRKISHVSHLLPLPSPCQPCVAQLGGHLNFKSLLNSPKHEKENSENIHLKNILLNGGN